MDNLFPEHNRRLNKALIKDDKDRQKRLERKGDGGPVRPYTGPAYDDIDLWDYAKTTAMARFGSRTATVGKFESLGYPFLMSVADWVIIGAGPTPSKRTSAFERQLRRYQELTG